MLILVAEDDADGLALLSRFLRRKGHEVVTACDGRDAFEKTLSARPDLVLMDVSLPGLSGLDAARLIRSDTAARDVPIVAVTAHAMSEDRRRCLEAGCDAYVAKPIDFDELGGVIDAITRDAPFDRRSSPP